jgi:hypothetical protein
VLTAAVLLSLLAQTPSTYASLTDRGPRAKPTLIKPGNAGSSFKDPVFGSRILRVTDRSTRPEKLDASYRTPSATHQNAWSADSSYFYVVSTDGTVVPFAFNKSTGAASRLSSLRFYIEPQFSYVSDTALYGSVSGGSLRTIDQYDFATGAYTQLFDLETLVPGLQGTYIGGISSTGGPTERVLTFFGGDSQDRHHYVLLFDKNAPATRQLLDTAATLHFNLHHASIDRSGRYVLLYPTGPDLAPPRSAAQVYVWDTQQNVTTPLPLVDARSGGHDAYGYGYAVNQDCCSSTDWDAAQWQIRSLATPLVTKDTIAPILNPREVYLADHPTWNNARPDRLVPFVTGTYRYGANDADWRAWDDEILAVQTDGGSDGAVVYRFAHHRSDVRNDDTPAQTSFWYLPRPNVSRDGRWVLFTSNWEKTLGTDPGGAPGEKARQDVFLLQLTPADVEPDAPPPAPIEVTSNGLPDAKVKSAYSVQLQSSRPATWRVSQGTLPPGLTLTGDGRITGTPMAAGGWYFEVIAADAASSGWRVFLLTVRK